jgi:hypothetical protein
VKEDQEAASQAHCQTDDVQETVQFLSFDDPQSDLKIVFYHNTSPINGIPYKSRQGLEKHEPKPQGGPNLTFHFASVPVGLFEIADDLMIIFLVQEKPKQGFTQAWNRVCA